LAFCSLLGVDGQVKIFTGKVAAMLVEPGAGGGRLSGSRAESDRLTSRTRLSCSRYSTAIVMAVCPCFWSPYGLAGRGLTGKSNPHDGKDPLAPWKLWNARPICFKLF